VVKSFWKHDSGLHPHVRENWLFKSVTSNTETQASGTGYIAYESQIFQARIRNRPGARGAKVIVSDAADERANLIPEPKEFFKKKQQLNRALQFFQRSLIVPLSFQR
jgi:hypothetical protein